MPTSPNVIAASDVTLVTTAETVIATTVARAVNAPGSQGQYIDGMINITPGTAATAVVIRVRAGNGLSGAVIGGPETHTVAAGANQSIPYAQIDGTTVGQVQYTLTVQQTAATGNGSINLGTIREQTTNSAGA